MGHLQSDDEPREQARRDGAPSDGAPSDGASSDGATQPGATHTVVITVIRSGGIAGRRRSWRAEPPPDDTPRWQTLVDRCPWDDTGGDAPGADRFVWIIRVADGHIPPREAELPDSRLDGPWRELVDAVRAAAS
jgi:hypothetical protein